VTAKHRHTPGKLLAAIEDAGRIDSQNVVPVCIRQLEEWHKGRDTGVGDEAVKGPEGRFGRVHAFAHGLTARHIQQGAEGVQLGGDPLSGRFVEIGHGNVEVAFGEQTSGRRAYATSRSCDQDIHDRTPLSAGYSARYAVY
jgi:hypothetical protein